MNTGRRFLHGNWKPISENIERRGYPVRIDLIYLRKKGD